MSASAVRGGHNNMFVINYCYHYNYQQQQQITDWWGTAFIGVCLFASRITKKKVTARFS